VVQDLHHQDVVSMSNLEMILESIFNSHIQLKAQWDAIISRKGKEIFKPNQINNEFVEDLLHQDVHS
jgi:hypothetical protein